MWYQAIRSYAWTTAYEFEEAGDEMLESLHFGGYSAATLPSPPSF